MTRNVVIVNTVTKQRVKELSLLHAETEGRIVAMAVYLLEQTLTAPCPDVVERVYKQEKEVSL